MRAGRVLITALLLGAMALGASAADEALNQTMQRVLARLSEVLPLAFEEDRTPDERRVFAERLDALIEAAERIDDHAAGRDLGFATLSRSLRSDLEDARESWQRGAYEGSGYYLVQATSNCFTCHARLPGDALSPLSKKIETVIENHAESVHEKAQLLVATRQFDRALAQWETLIADPEFAPAQLDVGGYLLDYLTVSIRVRSDLERPRLHLERLADRSDTPLYLRRLLRGWIAQLDELAARPAPTDPLAAARQLIEDATTKSPFASGRERTIADLQASAWLLQRIEAGPPNDPALAEAFYLLGLVEARSVDGFWVPLTDAHLEAAVRTAPDGPFAERAYALLEEYWTLSYGGIREPHLPPDQLRRLGELSELMSAAAAPAAP